MQQDLKQTIPPQQWRALTQSLSTSANQDTWLSGPLRGVIPSDMHATWAKFHLAVHGTTTERALQIIEDQTLYAHRTLARIKPEIVRERLQNATDELDIKLDLDRFAFLSVGRIHPFDVHDVYFLFKNNLILEPSAIVALKEIVHFGALVSPEAVGHFRKSQKNNDSINAEEKNFRAAEHYFKNVFAGNDFVQEIFPRFLAKNFPRVNDFVTTLLYPEDELRISQYGQSASINGWEGPQLQVPGQISLQAHSPSILITTADPERIDRIMNSGFPRDRIYTMREAITIYERLYKRKGVLGSYTDQMHRGAYVNLALRDLALLPHHNVDGESFPDSMAGFKNRL